MWGFNTKILLYFLLLSDLAFGAPTSYQIYGVKVDESITTCPTDQKLLAQEALDLELRGMRWLKSKPACFTNLKMKYVYAYKNPDEAVSKLVSVKEGSVKIESVTYNKDFFNYRVKFSVLSSEGKKIEDSFSFMTNTKNGGAKPETGCALISTNPSKAFV